MGKKHGECAYCETNVYKEGKFKCLKKSNYREDYMVYANEEANCSSFCPRWSWDKDKSKYAVDKSNSYEEKINKQNGGCYITTIVTNLLGMGDNCNELETLRWFRNNIMVNDERYQSILFQYDVVGPILARKLALESEINNTEDFSNFIDYLYNVYIKGTCLEINKGKTALEEGNKEKADLYFKKAVVLYEEMTNNLNLKYQSRTMYSEKLEDNYDYSKAGHGKIVG